MSVPVRVIPNQVHAWVHILRSCPITGSGMCMVLEEFVNIIIYKDMASAVKHVIYHNIIHVLC